MSQIIKRGKNYSIRFWANGREVWEAVGPSRRDAERVLARRQLEVREGRYLDKRKRCNLLFSDFAPRFLEWSRAHKRSWRRDALCVRNLSARFAREKLEAITPALLERYRQARLSGEIRFGKKLPSARTVNIEAKCLCRMLSLAVAWGELASNSLAGFRHLKEAGARLRYLRADEIGRLLEQCADHLRPVVRLALATGMRRGEVIGLTWAEVDMRAGLIHLAPERCKSGKGRTIPLSDEARAVLRERWHQRAEGCELVFHRAGRSLGDVKTAFHAACRRAGLGPEVTFHTLRHTWASHAVMAGAPLPAVQAVLGHSTITTTMRYSHLAPNTLAATVRLASEGMGGVEKVPSDATDRSKTRASASGGEVVPLEIQQVR